MELLFSDLTIVGSRVGEYLFQLNQTQLLVHFAAFVIGGLAMFGVLYKFHVWVMADHGVTWTWLLRGVYAVVIVAAATGTLYNWAKFEAEIADSNQFIAIVFFILPLIAGIALLASANYAAKTVKIERIRRRGDRVGV